MNILWFTWKDRKHPWAGGAEVVNEELAKRLVQDGHKVIFVVGGFPGGEYEEERDGFKIIRLGGCYNVYLKAFWFYRRNLKGWADLVIDEINTMPFFSKFYVKEKNVLFVHQLCRKIWFHQMPMPLSLIGYLVEPIYLWLLHDRKVITISESTKKDLMRFGFKDDNIEIISEGIEIESVRDIKKIKKFAKPTMLSFGTVRAMKNTVDIIKAFDVAKKDIPELQLIIAGSVDGKYEKQFNQALEKSPFRDSIKHLGKVSLEKKIQLMQKAHVLCAASVKEGWGLVVTESNSQGTPAVVYNVDGLRDSVKHNVTGIICKKNTPESMGKNISRMLLDQVNYDTLRTNAWLWSKEINFERSFKEFKKIISKVEQRSVFKFAATYLRWWL